VGHLVLNMIVAMPTLCKTCEAPSPIRDLVERMRTAGISYRDVALAIKAMRDYDLSHAAIQRHESLGHYDPQHIIASQTLIVNPEEISVGSVARHKLMLYWQFHRDDVPTSPEARAWMKTLSEFAEADASQQEAKALRELFKPKVIGPGE
jgi:hypothetical protein